MWTIKLSLRPDPLHIALSALILGPVLFFAFIYFGYNLEVRWFESAPAYHLRRLRYHAEESKDGDRRLYHADRLVACADDAVPVLLEAMCAFADSRYPDVPYRILRRIYLKHPAPEELRSKVWRLRASCMNERYTREEQLLALNTARLVSCDELAALDPWIDGIQHPSVELDAMRIRYLSEFVEDYLKGRLPRDAPYFRSEWEEREGPINPDFLAWWEANREQLVASTAASE